MMRVLCNRIVVKIIMAKHYVISFSVVQICHHNSLGIPQFHLILYHSTKTRDFGNKDRIGSFYRSPIGILMVNPGMSDFFGTCCFNFKTNKNVDGIWTLLLIHVLFSYYKDACYL